MCTSSKPVFVIKTTWARFRHGGVMSYTGHTPSAIAVRQRPSTNRNELPLLAHAWARCRRMINTTSHFHRALVFNKRRLAAGWCQRGSTYLLAAVSVMPIPAAVSPKRATRTLGLLWKVSTRSCLSFGCDLPRRPLHQDKRTTSSKKRRTVTICWF